jgi:hypothetical protein
MGDVWISRAPKRLLSVAVAALLLFPAAASAAPPPVGGLTQLSGGLGCFTTAASATCQLATGINEAESVVVSPDGRYVYAGSYPSTSGTWRQPSLTVFSARSGDRPADPTARHRRLPHA